MESLAPECTPLKRAYDGCFNAWFEGYLKPALDQSRLHEGTPTIIQERISPQEAVVSSSSSGSSPSGSRQSLSTSWSSVFTGSSRQPSGDSHLDKAPAAKVSPSLDIESDQPTGHALPPIDIAGKTRAQVKAEEYERLCGSRWRAYQSCVSKAIRNDSNLSELLEQARVDHPLGNLHELGGTPWDARRDFTSD